MNPMQSPNTGVGGKDFGGKENKENNGSPPGWWNPAPFNVRSKFHYIDENGRSLCRKWLYMQGVIEQGMDNHSDNCAPCKKKKLKLNANTREGII